MQIIEKAHRVEGVRYSRDFRWKDSTGGGYGFECDDSGKVNIAELQKRPLAFQNYLKCLFNHEEIQDMGTSESHWSYREPAVGLCKCGCEVVLHGFTNTCDNCNRDYNGSGQLLAPRSQWGEETGESFSDILNI